jgi:predicted secreted protein
MKTLVTSTALAFLIAAIPAAVQAQTGTATTLRLARGEAATIELQENPSTGYKWQIAQQGSSKLEIVAISDLGFGPGGSPGQKALLGAPGQHRWKIEALAAGHATVTFIYLRAWEKVPPTRRHEVTIDIR